MKKKITISVVIPAFNEEKFLNRTLISLLNQDFKNFEIIVVDNNSSDKTTEVAKKFGAKVVFERNQGVALARQKGFQVAQGEIIAFTDADTILPANWLSRIFKEFKKDENLIAFGGSAEFYSGSVFVKFASRYLLPLFLKIDDFFSNGPNLMGCNMAIKRTVLLKIGGFDTDLKLNEDVAISYKLRKIGKIKFDPYFKVKTSGRRFRTGLILGIINYAPTTIYRWLFKRFDKFQFFPAIRKETPSFFIRFTYLFLIFLVCLSIFYWFTSKTILAQNLMAKVDLVKVSFKNELAPKIKKINIKNYNLNIGHQ